MRPAQSAGTPLQYRSLLKSWLDGSFCNQQPPPYRKCCSRASFSPAASLGAAETGRALKPAAPSVARPAATRRKSRRPTPAALRRAASRSIWTSEMRGSLMMTSSLVGLFHFRIERVADAVAEERERGHGDGDGARREQGRMPVRPDGVWAQGGP